MPRTTWKAERKIAAQNLSKKKGKVTTRVATCHLEGGKKNCCTDSNKHFFEKVKVTTRVAMDHLEGGKKNCCTDSNKHFFEKVKVTTRVATDHLEGGKRKSPHRL